MKNTSESCAPAYDFAVHVGDSAQFNFGVYEEAEEFCKRLRKMMKGHKRCTLLKYDRENVCYQEIFIKEE